MLHNFYKYSIAKIFDLFQSNIDGLTNDFAKNQQSVYGKNQIVEKKKDSIAILFFRQFKDLMILVLVVAALISGILGDWIDALVIFSIVILNACIGVFQEYKAAKALNALKKISIHNVLVKRSGKTFLLNAIDIVPGDIVFLEAGQIVPADIRIISKDALKVGEASLTGESEDVFKTIEPLNRDLSILDQTNMLFKGTVVKNGQVWGVVCAIGMQTEIGKIASLLVEDSRLTPLQNKLKTFSKQITIVLVVLCFVVLILGILWGVELLYMVMTALSMAVAAIPESLPAVISISLALGARQMIKVNALSKSLSAVETLGSVTVICTDKTGTLTENKMSVVDFYYSTNCTSFERQLLNVNLFKNNSLIKNDNDEWLGDSTELALFEFFNNNFNSTYTPTFEILKVYPFDSDRMCMSILVKIENQNILLVKGALEVLINNSINNIGIDEWKNVGDLYAEKGYRTIGFAYKLIKEISEVNEDKLTLLGIAGIFDPPRKEVLSSVNHIHHAGIKSVMITGDHPKTAFSIAKELAICNNVDEVITGYKLSELFKNNDITEIIQKRVFSRVTPQQKLMIIKAFQQSGEIVAMTGDGVNDAPALKAADIGIAMGVTGTDVSKEAADLILLDDNYATISNAIDEGRRIFSNILKFIQFALSCNLGELIALLIAPLLGMSMPLLPLHILWVNLVTDGVPGLTLSNEPIDTSVLKQKPRSPHLGILGDGLWLKILFGGVLIGAVTIFAQWWTTNQHNQNWQTITFNVLCFSQMGYIFSIKSDKSMFNFSRLFNNFYLVVSVIITVGIQLLISYIPFFQNIFHLSEMSIEDLYLVFGFSLIPFVIIETIKLFKQYFRG